MTRYQPFWHYGRMGTSQTYDEAHEKYKEVMGEELGSTYHVLWNECALLHMRWHEYCELYVKDPREFDIMNETAPGFFGTVQTLYWESILLGLCRFADNQKVAGRKTLSLETLAHLAAAEVPFLLEKTRIVKETCRFAQDWRNRRIAHADHSHALQKTLKPLAAASRVDVRSALAAIVNVLTEVESHFMGGGLGFIGTGLAFNGSYLLAQLRVARSLQREHRERMMNGTPREDDNDWDKWRGHLPKLIGQHFESNDPW